MTSTNTTVYWRYSCKYSVYSIGKHFILGLFSVSRCNKRAVEVMGFWWQTNLDDESYLEENPS